MTAELTMTVSHSVTAPPGRVYEAWLDPAILSRFMLPCTGGRQAEVHNDPRTGGTFRIVMFDGETAIPHHGTYLELVPDERLRFTWVSPHSVEGSVVTVALTAEGQGTRIELRQDRFASEGLRDGHLKGWTVILGELQAAL
ncbi:MAG: SRPBCC domain-containing protein [Paracoccaceae bacterium]|nr:MAG: SRPBCC domain-containing protein [Paracoccaceae bacterium]